MHLLERLRSWMEPPYQQESEDLFRALWKLTARADSTRHPFHPEVLGDLDTLIAMVGAAPADTLIEVGNTATTWDLVQHRYPCVARRLTPAWMRSFVAAEVDRVAAVADSDDYLTDRSRDLSSDRIQHRLTVQHRLSGLRATFFWKDGAQVGGVVAKSYSIGSIDPNRDETRDGMQAVDNWEGLGITTRLYQQAATLQPDLRWGVTILTDQSPRLRRRLHRIDPWRFAAAKNPARHPNDTCGWCIQHGWARLDRSSFASHPVDQ